MSVPAADDSRTRPAPDVGRPAGAPPSPARLKAMRKQTVLWAAGVGLGVAILLGSLLFL